MPYLTSETTERAVQNREGFPFAELFDGWMVDPTLFSYFRSDLSLAIAFGQAIDGSVIRNGDPLLFLEPRKLGDEAVLRKSALFFSKLHDELKLNFRKVPFHSTETVSVLNAFLNYALCMQRDLWIENLAALCIKQKFFFEPAFLLAACIHFLNNNRVGASYYASFLDPNGKYASYAKLFFKGTIAFHLFQSGHENSTDRDRFDTASLLMLNGHPGKAVFLLSRIRSRLKRVAIEKIATIYFENGRYRSFLSILKRSKESVSILFLYRSITALHLLGLSEYCDSVIITIFGEHSLSRQYGEFRDALGGEKAKRILFSTPFRDLIDLYHDTIPESVRQERSRLSTFMAVLVNKELPALQFRREWIGSVTRISGWNYLARIYLGFYYDSIGDKKRAHRFLCSMDTHHPAVLFKRAELSLYLKRPEAALNDYRILMKYKNGDPLVWRNFSRMLARAGLGEEADFARSVAAEVTEGG